MDSMNTIVAKNIKRLREEKKLSMDELAKLSGVSKKMCIRDSSQEVSSMETYPFLMNILMTAQTRSTISINWFSLSVP